MLFASSISEARLLNALFVLLQQSQTEVATALMSDSASLRSWQDFDRSECELQE